ncbi:hypothetical protein Z043_112667 [Scleropages formosus]|uniref:PX domain-containing protein n=1 Tax=Scleropages formosus TaxID=113540 RepID=A0A0P7X3N7_SCLFO|nr:hypothetical protein Z043_112667 [Scleropages formosus]
MVMPMNSMATFSGTSISSVSIPSVDEGNALSEWAPTSTAAHWLPSTLQQDGGRGGLVKIKEARDIEVRLNEVERFLKNAINMPWKFSRSEVMLTFFERSPLDQVLKNDSVHKILPCFPSTHKISEIMRSHGFCLANTEASVRDKSLLPDKERPSSTDSAEDQSGEEFLTAEPGSSSDDDPESYVTNLSYYHLVPFETDIPE